MPLFRRRQEQRSLATDLDPLSIIANARSGVMPSAGIVVTESTALSVISVQACVGIIADSVASLPLHGYNRSGSTLTRIDPTPAILADPFFGVSRLDGLFQMVASLALRGNAYALIVRDDETLLPSQLVILHPDWVAVTRAPDGSARYIVNGKPMASSDVLHIRGFQAPGSLMGYSTIDMAAQSIGLALATEDFAARFFGQSATASGVITTDTDLTADQARTLAESIQAHHSGLRRSQLPMVLTGGAKWTPITITPDNAQFLQSRQWSQAQIATLFRVPPHLLGDQDKSTSWGTGIEVMGRTFITHTLRPYLARIELALSSLLPLGTEALFDTQDFTRGDNAARSTFYASALGWGWLSVNEVRSMENLPPVDGGDTYRAPVNTAPIGDTPPALMPGDSITGESPVDDSFLRALRAMLPPTSRRIERDTEGNISRIVEEV